MTYFWTTDENNEIFCNLVMAKPGVVPLKFVSVLHLELTAATLAERGSKLKAGIRPQN